MSVELARDVQISTRKFGLSSKAIMIEGEPEDPSTVVNGNRQISYLPSTASVHSFWYKRRWVQLTRSVRESLYGRQQDLLELWSVFHVRLHEYVCADHSLVSSHSTIVS